MCFSNQGKSARVEQRGRGSQGKGVEWGLKKRRRGERFFLFLSYHLSLLFLQFLGQLLARRRGQHGLAERRVIVESGLFEQRRRRRRRRRDAAAVTAFAAAAAGLLLFATAAVVSVGISGGEEVVEGATRGGRNERCRGRVLLLGLWRRGGVPPPPPPPIVSSSGRRRSRSGRWMRRRALLLLLL